MTPQLKWRENDLVFFKDGPDGWGGGGGLRGKKDQRIKRFTDDCPLERRKCIVKVWVSLNDS